MPEMGRYCKAYLASSLRKFPAWTEDLAQLRKDSKFEDGKEVIIPRDVLLDEDILYIQENYVVTDGIFKDQSIIFGDVTDEWKQFCTTELKFTVPDYVTATNRASEPTAEAASSTAVAT